MRKVATIGAACLAVVLAAASPALARGVHGGAGHAGFHAGGAHFAGGGGRGFRGGGGFGPGIAAGVVAGAVLGAGTGYYGGYGPGYYGDSYAYDNGDDGYAPAPYVSPYNTNGFVCQPGTWFRGEDGRRHICQ